jgi:hypothetical protein
MTDWLHCTTAGALPLPVQVEVPQPQEEEEEDEDSRKKKPCTRAARLARDPITALLCATLYRLMQMLFLFLFLLLCFCLDSLPAAAAAAACWFWRLSTPTTQPQLIHPLTLTEVWRTLSLAHHTYQPVTLTNHEPRLHSTTTNERVGTHNNLTSPDHVKRISALATTPQQTKPLFRFVSFDTPRTKKKKKTLDDNYHNVLNRNRPEEMEKRKNRKNFFSHQSICKYFPGYL